VSAPPTQVGGLSPANTTSSMGEVAGDTGDRDDHVQHLHQVEVGTDVAAALGGLQERFPGRQQALPVCGDEGVEDARLLLKQLGDETPLGGHEREEAMQPGVDRLARCRHELLARGVVMPRRTARSLTSQG
jgi:hypothetical protein